MGEHDDELYIRWLQLAVFLPILRLHSTSLDVLGKEPWNFSWEAETLGTEYLQLRHRMIPYIYSMNYRTFKDGRALCEPLYYTYPDNKESFENGNEYFFGSELLVAPVTTKIDAKTKTAATKMWLPEGRWTNILDGKIYKGGQKVVINSPINTIPVLAKEGAILQTSLDEGNGWGCPENLKIDIYRGNNSVDFYEDDGESGKYKNGEYSITKMTVSEGGNIVNFKINGGTAISCIPAQRNYTFEFKDIASFDEVNVMINGLYTPVNVVKNTFTLHSVSVADEINIAVAGVVAKKNKPVNDRALDCLIHLNGNNMKKVITSKRIMSCKDKKDFKAINRMIKSKSLRMCLDEAVFAMED